MKMSSMIVLGLMVIASGCLADVSHLFRHDEILEATTSYPPLPYKFNYKAGRYPGQIDRYQSESGDGAGTVRGTYSFIDPKFKIRTVDYTADKNGFHPILKNYEDTQIQPVDSEAVKLAKDRHHALYERIANDNAQGTPQFLPRETASVQRARNKHLELFEKIAAEHQAIAAQRGQLDPSEGSPNYTGHYVA
ncbi:uncharacterized protein LOC122852221 isoform X1 [Aphidius gifuensis]|uniref:uncharacterized protein LOC122852221 isoform X1 n=1 Tax=Aphidius gifuensis TaxID=684658 RepID=UPI001CDC93EA|nr:uncharacterized protein LOC122852221 isoform X1 [Aphidius gifuensis]